MAKRQTPSPRAAAKRPPLRPAAAPVAPSRKRAATAGAATPPRQKRAARKQRERAAPSSRKRAAAPKVLTRTAAPKVLTRAGGVVVSEVEELEQLRRELERTARAAAPMKWNADPEDVQRSVAHLVLTLIEFVRRLLERQAIRRMEAGTLDDEQTEDVGRALMKLEETVHDIAARFGIHPDDLNLELGPVGKLM